MLTRTRLPRVGGKQGRVPVIRNPPSSQPSPGLPRAGGVPRQGRGQDGLDTGRGRRGRGRGGAGAVSPPELQPKPEATTGAGLEPRERCRGNRPWVSSVTPCPCLLAVAVSAVPARGRLVVSRRHGHSRAAAAAPVLPGAWRARLRLPPARREGSSRAVHSPRGARLPGRGGRAARRGSPGRGQRRQRGGRNASPGGCLRPGLSSVIGARRGSHQGPRALCSGRWGT